MTLELTLSTETEAKIRKHTAASGQDIEAFVLQAVAEKLAEIDLQRSVSPHNDKEWAQKLRACIDLHPVVTWPVDDRREAIYAGRGE